MVEFNPQTQYVLRNNRHICNEPEEEKQTTNSKLSELLSSDSIDYSKTTIESYVPFNNKDNYGTKQTYYDTNGTEVGSLSVWTNKGKQSTCVCTQDADYFDWDSNGTIDTIDTDNVYDKKINQKETDSIFSRSYNQKDNQKETDSIFSRFIDEYQ